MQKKYRRKEMKLKGLLLLNAAILLMLLSLFELVNSAIDIAEWGFGWKSDYFNILMLILGPVGIVIGIFILTRLDRPNMIFNLAGIFVLVAMLVIYVAFLAIGMSNDGWGIYIGVPLGIAAGGLLIATFFVDDDVEIGQMFSDEGNKKEKNIETLKKMRNEGQITEEEYKELLMKELEK